MPRPHPQAAPKKPILDRDKLTKSLDFSKEKGNLVRLLFLQLKVSRNYNFVSSLKRSSYLEKKGFLKIIGKFTEKHR